MKSGRAEIGSFQKMRIKNLMGSVRSDLIKLDSFTLEMSKNHLIRNFPRNGRLRVNLKFLNLKIKDFLRFKAQSSFQDKFKVQGLDVTRVVFKITELKINIREMVCILRDVLLFNIQ